MRDVRRILHPTDFSDLSKRALPYVRHYATLHDAEIHLLHVLEPMVSTTDFTWSGLSFGELEQRRMEGAQEAMASLVLEMELGDRKVVTAVERGKSHDVVREYAEQKVIDLVILATHGHTGLTHLLLGSTAEMVVRTAPCPVLTVKGGLEPAGTET